MGKNVFRDPFAENMNRAKKTPEELEKYNYTQKLTGGFPIDLYGSEEVDSAIMAEIRVIKERFTDVDLPSVREFLTYAIREDGPHSNLSKEERQRVFDIVLEYFA